MHFVNLSFKLYSNGHFVHFSLGHANGTLSPVRHFGFSSYPLLAQNSVAWVSIIDSECNKTTCVFNILVSYDFLVLFHNK